MVELHRKAEGMNDTSDDDVPNWFLCECGFLLLSMTNEFKCAECGAHWLTDLTIKCPRWTTVATGITEDGE